MTSVPPQDDKAKQPTTKAKATYKIGIVLVIVGIVYGIVILALHYGTKGNMFAGHSLINYSSTNPLPLVVASAGIIFIVGIVLVVLGRPVPQAAKTTAT